MAPVQDVIRDSSAEAVKEPLSLRSAPKLHGDS